MSERTPRNEVHEELKSIYAEADGAMPDLTSLERKHSNPVTRALLIIVVTLAIIATAAWAGFFVWTRGWFAADKPLVVSIEGPETVEAGDQVFYTVRYENNGSVPVASLDVQLHLPAGFQMLTEDPMPTDGDHWKIGTLTPGSDGAIIVGGVFRSEVGSSQTLQAFFTYRPANFSSDFEAIATKTVVINGSALAATVTGPEKALAGDEVTYTINVENRGTRAVENILVVSDLPEAFTITASEPASRQPDLPQWHLASLAPGELTAITIRGRYTASASGSQVFRARVNLEQDTALLAQGSAETHTDVLGGNLVFHLVVNGATSATTVNPGEDLRFSIDYSNGGSEGLGGVSLTLDLDGGGKTLPIDWTKAELAKGRRSGNSIVWDEGAIPSFILLPPGSSGILDLSLPLLATIDPNTLADKMTATLSMSLAAVGSVESPRTVDASPLAIAINSDLKGSAEARYFTDAGEPLGTGPLPPKVGATTTYRIIWKIHNTMHPLKDVVMTTNLPPDVSWTENPEVERGALTFDPTTRLVSWKIDALSIDIKDLTATFDVAITPDASDKNAFVKLTNATSLDATDTVSGAHLGSAIDILTTELPTDVNAKGKGVVVE